jgi:hypothetical protein
MNAVNNDTPQDVFVAINILAELKAKHGDYNSIPAGSFAEQFENGLEYLQVCCEGEYDDSDFDAINEDIDLSYPDKFAA